MTKEKGGGAGMRGMAVQGLGLTDEKNIEMNDEGKVRGKRVRVCRWRGEVVSCHGCIWLDGLRDASRFMTERAKDG